MSSDHREQQQKVLELVRAAIERDEELRKQYEIGDKFRFVRDRLHVLLEALENHLVTEAAAEKVGHQIIEDEQLVYVYLYNAHGILLRNWQNLLAPKVFYEYSVNRPIYAEKKYLDSLLRAKGNKAHHAYLTVAVKKVDIYPSGESLDALGNPVIRVKEGALKFEKLISFTHNEMDYNIDEDGEFFKKE